MLVEVPAQRSRLKSCVARLNEPGETVKVAGPAGAACAQESGAKMGSVALYAAQQARHSFSQLFLLDPWSGVAGSVPERCPPAQKGLSRTVITASEILGRLTVSACVGRP